MIQPLRVLPSNAPPLRDSNNVHQASRKLQEYSGDRHHHDYVGGDGIDHRYPTPVLAGSVWPSLAQHQSTQQLYLPQPHHRHTVSYGHSRHYGYPPLKGEHEIRFEADQLYKRFKAAPQYKKYRQRQSKDDKGQDQKWPDHLEEAFFYALVKYQPMGRGKQQHKGKQRGRNELIADAIQELTGEARTRKQVSSHIQVLKPFVENDSEIMKHLSKEDTRDPSARHGGHHSSSYTSGRRASMYHASAPRCSTRSLTQAVPQTDLVKLAKVKHNLDVFEPTSFSMFVQRKFTSPNGEQQEERLHTYTKSIDVPLGPDLPVQDWVAFGHDYPCLAAMHATKPLDCNIIAADASLGIPTDTFRDKAGIELGISFVCSSRHLPLKANLKCHNSFYRNGQYLKDFSGAFDVEPIQQADDRHTTTSVKFGSTFWARTLAQLANRLREGVDKGPEHQDGVRGFIRGITAVQEFVVISEHGAERLLIVFWRFRQSSVATGRTSWQRLVLPSTEDESLYGDSALKTERVDSMCDYGRQFAEVPVSQAHIQPTLQSPFEYDSSSNSALSSATWSTSLTDGSGLLQPHGDASFAADNDFDFANGSINVAFDPHLDFSNLDFDVSNTMDFAADPELDQYSQQWCDQYANGFDDQAALSAISDDVALAAQLDGQTQTYNGYIDQYDPQMYGAGAIGEQQAYGGAGQDGIKHDDAALAALADASFVAQSLASRQGST